MFRVRCLAVPQDRLQSVLADLSFWGLLTHYSIVGRGDTRAVIGNPLPPSGSTTWAEVETCVLLIEGRYPGIKILMEFQTDGAAEKVQVDETRCFVAQKERATKADCKATTRKGG